MTSLPSTSPDAASQNLGTQSLERSIGLLKLVAANSHSGLRLVDLVRLSGVERPTAHRMVQSLMKHGLLSRPTGSTRYVLGEYCRELGAQFADRLDLRAICDPVLRAVSEETGNSSFLIIRMGLDSMCVARVIGSYPIQVVAVRVGNRQPLGVGAGGLALLATLPRAEQEECLHANAHRLTGYGSLNVSTLRAIISATQNRGYAVIGHYSVPGVIGVGVTLRNSAGKVLGAITTASIDSRMTKEKQGEAVQVVGRHVLSIQERLDLL
ncbi:IclR family transcriptional regulator [Glaciimonas sp. PCH181]|uniref:IclR family transcriptional regulator n=1 Tax=Glaciimonas sp. PCH181 TaxID=2133943 RepID=UPI000D3D1F35|nr:IclR family transcriptional regulator [Glaciimonas sp. PCH181]PUA20753.1 IclR family transcriptional regulator [Glaciimonas sp. PCH181]